MRKLITTITILVLLLSMLLFVGCEDKDKKNVVEVIDSDQIDVVLIDNWDLWEINSDTTAFANNPNAYGIYNNNRELIGYPFLVEELYLSIEKHKITLDGDIYDSSEETIESLHLIDNQMWTEDADGVATYYYDYFYNEGTGSLWLHEDTSPDTLWAVDPTVEEDSLGNNLYNADEFKLFYRSGTGPRTELVSPENNWQIPDFDDDDLSDMTPLFKWYTHAPVDEFHFQLCTDTLFTDGDGMVVDTLVTPATSNFTSFEVQDELTNFTDYYWRVKANNKDWSEVWYFRTNNIVVLESPGNGSYIALRPTLKWKPLTGTTTYTIQISKDNSFQGNGLIEDTTDQLQYVYSENFDMNEVYYWRVTSDLTPGEWSNAWKFNTTKGVSMEDTTPADEKSEVEIPVEFEWAELDNASEYTIQVATDSMFAADNIVLEDNVNTNNYTENNVLLANQTYYWRVDSDVSATWGDTLSFITNNAVILNTPAEDAANIGLIVKFKWDIYNEGETQYVIQVDDEDSFTDPMVDSYIYFEGEDIENDLICETASIIEYNDDDYLIEFVPELVEDFANNTQYYWRVQRDTLQWSETWNFTTTTANNALELQEPEDAAVNVELLPKLKWVAVSGAEYYRVLVSLDENFADTLWTNTVVTDNSYTLDADEDETLFLDEIYYWKVRSDRSDWSGKWSFQVIDGIPYNLDIIGEDGNNSELTPNKIDISWNASAEDEFENFIIERKINGTWEEAGTVEATQNYFVDFGLENDADYEYRIKTEYVRGFSDYSDVITVHTNSFVMENAPVMIEVAAGTFTMGDSLDADADEAPVHEVTLTNMIKVGDSEITNAQYCEVMNWALGMGKVANPNGTAGPYAGMNFADDAFNEQNILLEDKTVIDFNVGTKAYSIEAGMEDYPVVGVTFFGAVAYCNWYSEINGDDLLYSGTTTITRDPYSGTGYRLPTEAEWEFVATNRGNATYEYSGSDVIDEVGWYFGNASNAVHTVKGKAGNDLGIYDMSGNVWEWCNDKYGDYEEGAQTDPIGPAGNIGSNDQVVIRGGSWEYDEYHLRNTNRSSKKASENTEIGFRIIKVFP